MTRTPGAIILAALRREPPRWALDGLTELAVIQLAEAHGMLPVIAEIATRHALIPDVDTPTLHVRRDALSPRGVLLAARRESRDRHEDLDAIRGDAETALRERGVAYRHLKGGALRNSGVWSDFTARPTRDVDILVGDASAIPEIEAALIAAGFRRSDEVETNQAWQDDHHGLPLVHDGRAGSLELHAASLVRRHRDRVVLDIPTGSDDPDLAATLRHIIIHAQLQDDALLQWRLPIVPLLDVAFAIEAGLVTAATLVNGMSDRSARRAARVHLGLAARLRGTRIPGSARAGLRWRISGWLFGRPRASYLVRELAFAPRALSRSVMEARQGRELHGAALARARIGFLRTRIPRGARGAPPSARSAKLSPVQQGNPMVPGVGAGRDHMSEQVSWAVSPAKADGFEAVWSSSGLVLVDLAQDVLHHLNEPAAVVYDLVGDRSAAQIAEAFAVLAEFSDSDARDATATALAGLASIGAITHWPTGD